MEPFIVTLGIVFCIFNWVFFGIGHYNLSHIEKTKYQKLKLGSLYFTGTLAISMFILYIISLFNHLLQIKSIVLIMLIVEFTGTIIYIFVLDIIGITNKNNEIIKLILEQTEQNTYLKKDEIIQNVRNRYRNLSIKEIEKQYNKVKNIK